MLWTLCPIVWVIHDCEKTWLRVWISALAQTGDLFRVVTSHPITAGIGCDPTELHPELIKWMKCMDGLKYSHMLGKIVFAISTSWHSSHKFKYCFDLDSQAPPLTISDAIITVYSGEVNNNIHLHLIESVKYHWTENQFRLTHLEPDRWLRWRAPRANLTVLWGYKNVEVEMKTSHT